MRFTLRGRIGSWKSVNNRTTNLDNVYRSGVLTPGLRLGEPLGGVALLLRPARAGGIGSLFSRVQSHRNPGDTPYMKECRPLRGLGSSTCDRDPRAYAPWLGECRPSGAQQKACFNLALNALSSAAWEVSSAPTGRDSIAQVGAQRRPGISGRPNSVPLEPQRGETTSARAVRRPRIDQAFPSVPSRALDRRNFPSCFQTRRNAGFFARRLAR